MNAVARAKASTARDTLPSMVNVLGAANILDADPAAEIKYEALTGPNAEAPSSREYLKITGGSGMAAVLSQESRGLWLAMLSPCCNAYIDERRLGRAMLLKCSSCRHAVEESFSMPLDSSELEDELEYFLKMDPLLARMLIPTLIHNLDFFWHNPQYDGLLNSELTLFQPLPDHCDLELLLRKRGERSEDAACAPKPGQ